jgi:hypothetical protein
MSEMCRCLLLLFELIAALFVCYWPRRIESFSSPLTTNRRIWLPRKCFSYTHTDCMVIMLYILIQVSVYSHSSKCRSLVFLLLQKSIMTPSRLRSASAPNGLRTITSISQTDLSGPPSESEGTANMVRVNSTCMLPPESRNDVCYGLKETPTQTYKVAIVEVIILVHLCWTANRATDVWERLCPYFCCFGFPI